MYDRTLKRGASPARAFLFACLGAVLLAILLTSALQLPAVTALSPWLGLGTVGLLILGSLVYILAPLFSRQEDVRAQEAYGTHRDVLANIVSAVVLGNLILLPLLLILLVATGFIPLDIPAGAGPQQVLTGIVDLVQTSQSLLVVVALVGLDIALLAVVYLRTLRTGATTEREMGLVGSHFLRNFGLGVLGAVVILVISVAIGLALTQFGVQQTQTEELAITSASPNVFYMLLISGGLIAPFAEEIFFRGYVFRSYLETMGPVRAYLLSAFVFGILHLNAAAFLPLFVIGLVLAFLYHRSGSLVPSMVAHSLNNVAALVLAYYATGM
ncbi:MAG: CPBP family intramembrane metalloprotease [Dehalococcoidales bacterium]|nr:CPBP family intramembrane metalloprotease [Dehalococcoidales bacterium]